MTTRTANLGADAVPRASARPRRAPAWLRCIDLLIPAALAVRGPDSLRRARLAIGIIAAALASVAWSATQERILGTRLFPALAASLIPVLLGIGWVLRATSSLPLVGNLLAGLVFLLAMGVTAASGGGYVGALVFLPIVPALAALIAGRRAALAWALLTCAGLFCVAHLASLGTRFPLATDPEFVAAAKFRATGVVVMWLALIALLHESLKDAVLTDLAESESRYRVLAESSPLGILACDADGNVLIANASAQRILERLAIDVAGLDNLEREPRLAAAGITAVFARCLATRAVIEEELEIECADGTRRTLALRLAPLRRRSSEIHGAEALIEDVTLRRRAEHERAAFEHRLQHAQKLETLGLLSSRVAHDFNNLLTTIAGNTSLLLRQLAPGDSKHERARRIELATHHAAELTRQLLAYAGQGERRVEPLDVNGIVSDMARLLDTAVPPDVEIETDLAIALPEVRADRNQLRQVVMNLITNAGEAIGARTGTVRVRTRAVDLPGGPVPGGYLDDPLQAGRYVAIEVSDDGCGMDEATLARAFDPFFTTKSNGRGLGLSALLGIVRAHRGTLRVQSTFGLGTTFTILLPSVAVTGTHASAATDALDAHEPASLAS
ncbi:MAG: ATP-binding protein [bacterium]